jgi:hypothetical protein
VGAWLLGNSIYYLGAATAFSGPGIGIAICTFWALYHAGMIFRGFGVSQSLNSTVGQRYIDWVHRKAENGWFKAGWRFLEDFMLTWRGIGFTFKKTLFEEPLDKLYAPKVLINEKLTPASIRENIRGIRRLNPLIILGKLVYSILGMFRRQ